MKRKGLFNVVGKWLIIPAMLVVLLSSCEKEEDKRDEELNRNRGTFTARIDGQLWKADEIYFGWANEGKAIQISTKQYSDSSIFDFFFNNPKEGHFNYGDNQLEAVWSYDETQNDAYPWINGYFEVTRFTEDSLFVDAEFLARHAIDLDSISVTDVELAISTKTFN